VYLDMEEYRDMNVTAEAFMRTLDRPGLEKVGAGIALQAYMPDAYTVQKRLNVWARKRLEAGGAPVIIRLVKGANMEMERVEASLHGWPQAPFKSKIEVDANYKRMLHEGMRLQNIAAVRLGIASHNLFELAYGLVLAVEHGILDKVQFEMLEGMANPQRRALFELTQHILLYAPAVRKKDFIHAVGYLVRRLDENTGPDNFLRHAFNLEVDSEAWRRLETQFLTSFECVDNLPEAPRRTQDRRQPPPSPPEVEPVLANVHLRGQAVEAALVGLKFQNEPDTDFALPHNVEWARGIIAKWQVRMGDQAVDIPLVVNGEEIWDHREMRQCLDPSRPGIVVGRYREACEEDLSRAIHCAREDAGGWRQMVPEARSEILGRVAQELRQARDDLIGAAMADGGKIVTESDPEVSEAIDFVEYYRRVVLAFHRMPNLRARGKGVVAVVPPWNFPIAIPCGGVASALAAGNSVILKPASDTVLVAYEFCQCFWRAGVPRQALQFMPCSGVGVGSKLVSHPEVDVVILTGGTETAFRMLRQKPDMHLLAETGGKGATIVTGMADRQQAIKHVLHSAFSHSGQKCSATSLLILEEEVYNDPAFKATLRDAVESLKVGSAWDRQTRVGPLICPPGGVLEQGLKELEAGESWLVMPKRLEHNPQLYSPGVKWGVQPGSFTHMTELFGPVLGVMQAKDLEEAIALVNQTGYGLTSGLESLDDREQEIWRQQIRAGNLYINRVTTGAIVLRQPFGGMGKSAFGPGIKAGGPNYVVQLMDVEACGDPETSDEIQDTLLRHFRDGLLERRDAVEGRACDEVSRVIIAIGSYALNLHREFGREHDHFHLLGQDNVRRYLPVRELRIRLHPDDTFFELFARVAAARAAGCRMTVSIPPEVSVPGLDLLHELTEPWGGGIEFVQETDAELAQMICEGQTERVRYAAPDRVPAEIFDAVKDTGLYIARAPVLTEGRIELLWYMREQSISTDYHRYGNLGQRSDEQSAAGLSCIYASPGV
jgi:RHH-type proline utilization regulon transcriptional repressor/proline dehydrogenase/delta 1-pyrroline-5-carboxylate dehydrogenase